MPEIGIDSWQLPPLYPGTPSSSRTHSGIARTNLHEHNLVAFQVGQALLPRVDFEFGGIQWEWRDVAKPAHMRDGIIDPWRRSPLGKGEFTISGKYICCNSRAVKQYFDADFKAEIDLLKSTMGMRVPVVFWRPPAQWDWLDDYRRPITTGDAFSPTPGDPSPVIDSTAGLAQEPSSVTNGLCGIPVAPESGTWLWGFAKITGVAAPTSIDVVSGRSAAITVTGYMVEPLREMNWQFWRWGYPPPSRGSYTIEEMNVVMCSNMNTFYAPIYLPDCCDKARWWYRDPRAMLVDCTIGGYRDFVGYTMYSINGCLQDAVGIPVGGSFDPAVKIKAYNSGTLQIKTMRYGFVEIPLTGGEVISSSYESWLSDDAPNPDRAVFPRMAPQEINWIAFDGVADIGLVERWL